MGDEVIVDRLRALLGERLVVVRRRRRVGMTFDARYQCPIAGKQRGESVELRDVGRREVGNLVLVRIEVHRRVVTADAPGHTAVERHVEHDLELARRANVFPHHIDLAVRPEARDRIDAVARRPGVAIAAGAVADHGRRAPGEPVGRGRGVDNVAAMPGEDEAIGIQIAHTGPDGEELLLAGIGERVAVLILIKRADHAHTVRTPRLAMIRGDCGRHGEAATYLVHHVRVYERVAVAAEYHRRIAVRAHRVGGQRNGLPDEVLAAIGRHPDAVEARRAENAIDRVCIDRRDHDVGRVRRVDRDCHPRLIRHELCDVHVQVHGRTAREHHAEVDVVGEEADALILDQRPVHADVVTVGIGEKRATGAGEHVGVVDVDRHDTRVGHRHRAVGDGHGGKRDRHIAGVCDQRAGDVQRGAAGDLQLDRAQDVQIDQQAVRIVRRAGGRRPVHARRKSGTARVGRLAELHEPGGPEVDAVDADELRIREAGFDADVRSALVGGHQVARSTSDQHHAEIGAGDEEAHAMGVDGGGVEPAVPR